MHVYNTHVIQTWRQLFPQTRQTELPLNGIKRGISLRTQYSRQPGHGVVDSFVLVRQLCRFTEDGEACGEGNTINILVIKNENDHQPNHMCRGSSFVENHICITAHSNFFKVKL